MERKSPHEVKETAKARQSRQTARHDGSGDSDVAGDGKITAQRNIRSRSVGFRSRRPEDLKTDEFLLAKRMAQQAKEQQSGDAKAAKQSACTQASTKGSLSSLLFRDGGVVSSGGQHTGHRRGRSCHGLKAYPEYSLFGMGGRDHSRCQGSGDLQSTGKIS